MTVRYDCSISLDRADRSLPGGRRLQNDTRIRARCVGTEGSEGCTGASSLLSRPFSFIPAFLLDNERPGYRKELRAAYGRRQKRLPS